MRVYAMWYGGSGYSVGEIDENLEVFPSLRAAKKALIDRYESNGWALCESTYADGRTESLVYPCVERDGCEMWLYFYDPRETSDPYPDRRLTLGPRLGVRMEPC